MSDIQDAFYVAALELNRHGIPRGHVLQLDYLRSRTGHRTRTCFGWDIGTRLSVSSPELGHAGEYVVVGEQGDYSAGLHHATFYLEPRSGGDYWILASARWKKTRAWRKGV